MKANAINTDFDKRIFRPLYDIKTKVFFGYELCIEATEQKINFKNNLSFFKNSPSKGTIKKL